MDELVKKNKEYFRILKQIKDLYLFDTDQEAINFILSYEDEFEKEFINYLEAM